MSRTNWTTWLWIASYFLSIHDVIAGLDISHLQISDSVTLDAGDEAFMLHDYPEAAQIFMDCIARCKQEQDWASASFAAIRLAKCYIEMKDWNQSLSHLNDAEKFWRLHSSSSSPPLQISSAWAYFYSAVDQRSLMDLNLAVDKDSMASHLFSLLNETTISGEGDKFNYLAEYYLDYAKYLTGKGEYKAAMKRLELAANILGENKKSQLMKFWLTYQRARILADRGDTEGFGQQIELLAKHLKIVSDHSYEMMVEYQFLAAEYQFYLDNHLRSAHIYQNIYWEEKNREEINIGRLVSSAGMAGTCFIECDSFEIAGSFLKDALHYEQQRSDSRPGHLAHVYRQLARLEHQCFKREKAARKYFDLALNYYEKAGNRVSLSKVLIEIAEMSEEKHIDESIVLLDLALDTLGFKSDLSNGGSLINLDRNLDDFFDPLFKLAHLLLEKYRRNHHKGSLFRANRVVQLIEQMGENTQNGKYSENTKRVVSEHFRRGAMVGLGVLDGLSGSLDDSTLVSRAFDLMEHNRYRILHHDVTLAKNRQSLSIPDSIVQMASNSRARVKKFEAQLSLDPGNIDLLDSLEQAQLKWNQMEQEVTGKYPNYHELHYTEMLSFADVQDRMGEGEQLVEYFWGDSLLFLVTANRDSSLFTSIEIGPLRTQLEEVLTFINLSKPSLPLDTFLLKSHFLYQKILEPFVFESTSRLFFSPDGSLNRLPFEVLLTSEHSNHADTIPYLLRRFESQYIYSCNLWHRDKEAQRRISRVLALAYGLASEQGLSPELDLPFSVEEVSSISQHLGESNVTTLEGRLASRRSFLQEVGDHSVVHLALHGVADTNHLERAHLLFPQLDSSERFLFAHDLYDLDVDLQLAVLSACQTGVGKQLDGEGVFSIARGFAYAGTPSVIMSLWNANDQTTSQIMGRFYELLAEGQNFSAALRQAKIDYLEEASPRYRSPYFWATLVGYGHLDQRILLAGNSRILSLIIVLGGGTALLLIIYLSKSKPTYSC